MAHVMPFVVLAFLIALGIVRFWRQVLAVLLLVVMTLMALGAITIVEAVRQL